jgi:hypothetical protein
MAYIIMNDLPERLPPNNKVNLAGCPNNFIASFCFIVFVNVINFHHHDQNGG